MEEKEKKLLTEIIEKIRRWDKGLTSDLSTLISIQSLIEYDGLDTWRDE